MLIIASGCTLDTGDNCLVDVISSGKLSAVTVKDHSDFKHNYFYLTENHAELNFK